MPFRLSHKFVALTKNIQDAARLDFVEESLETLAEDVIRAMGDIADESGITLDGEWRDSFYYDIDRSRKSLDLHFHNDATERGGDEYASYVGEGAGPHHAGRVVAPVVEWAERRLGVDASESEEVWKIAKSVATQGQQISNESTLRQLPPKDSVGYDPLLHISEEGYLSDNLRDFLYNTEVKLKILLNRGL